MPWPKGIPHSQDHRAKIEATRAISRADGVPSGWPKGRRRTSEHQAKITAKVKGRHREITCGHPERAHAAKGLCKSCYQVQWMRAHPEANAGNTWSRNHPERSRLLRRKSNWKRRGLQITPDQYAEMWAAQEGACANPGCRATYPLDASDYRRNALHVDHDHTTKLIRGLLCPSCNVALGHAGDDIPRLLGLVDYLREHQASRSV